MKDIFIAALSGGAVVAFINGAIMLIKWGLERRAKKADHAQARQEAKEDSCDCDIYEALAEIKAELEKLTPALKSLLIDRIRFLGQKYIENGEVDFDDLRMLNEMHQSAHGVGVNGSLDGLMKAVKALPLKRRE